jgi:hypothetical protein
MVEVMRQQHNLLKKKSGSAQLSLEDQVLVGWQYWRGAGDAPPPGKIAHTFTLQVTGVYQNQPSAEPFTTLKPL